MSKKEFFILVILAAVVVVPGGFALKHLTEMSSDAIAGILIASALGALGTLLGIAYGCEYSKARGLSWRVKFWVVLKYAAYAFAGSFIFVALFLGILSAATAGVAWFLRAMGGDESLARMIVLGPFSLLYCWWLLRPKEKGGAFSPGEVTRHVYSVFSALRNCRQPVKRHDKA